MSIYAQTWSKMVSVELLWVIFLRSYKDMFALLIVPYTGRKNINTYRISRDSGDLEVPYAGPEDHNKVWVIIRFLNIKIWFLVWILFFPNLFLELQIYHSPLVYDGKHRV